MRRFAFDGERTRLRTREDRSSAFVAEVEADVEPCWLLSFSCASFCVLFTRADKGHRLVNMRDRTEAEDVMHALESQRNEQIARNADCAADVAR